jgi:hypothetical protein
VSNTLDRVAWDDYVDDSDDDDNIANAAYLEHMKYLEETLKGVKPGLTGAISSGSGIPETVKHGLKILEENLHYIVGQGKFTPAKVHALEKRFQDAIKSNNPKEVLNVLNFGKNFANSSGQARKDQEQEKRDSMNTDLPF